MFTLSSEVYGLIILLFIPLLWSIHTSLSHPHSKLVQDPIEAASSEQGKEPREEAEDVHLDSDSDITTITGDTLNNNNNNNNEKPLQQKTKASPNLHFSEVLVIFEQSN